MTPQQRISEVDLDRITTGTTLILGSLGRLLGCTPKDEPSEFVVLVPNELCSPHPFMKQRMGPCAGSRGIYNIALKQNSVIPTLDSSLYYLYCV